MQEHVQFVRLQNPHNDGWFNLAVDRFRNISAYRLIKLRFSHGINLTPRGTNSIKNFTYFVICGNVYRMKDRGKPIYINKELHAKLKATAAKKTVSMRDFVEPWLYGAVQFPESYTTIMQSISKNDPH